LNDASQRRFRLLAGLLLSVSLWVSCGPPGVDEQPWGEFRGSSGTGIAADAELPTVWGEGSDNILWSTEVPGSGRSSPIVAHGRVYVALAKRDGADLEHGIAAIDSDSGELLWKTTVSRRPKLTLRNRYGVHAGATPAADEDRVYVYYGAELAALDQEGQILWKQEVEPDWNKTTRYGAGSSPILVGDVVVILQDKEYAKADYDVGWLAAFDRETGALRWKTEFDEGCCAYTTPTLRETEQGTEIIVPLTQRVAAFSAETGELLWQDAQDMNQPVASAALEGDLLCVASGAHNVRETVCRRLSGSGKETSVEVLWRTNRGVSETSSPVLYEGRLYVVAQKGMLTCFDAATGSILWHTRLEPGGYHASLVAGAGKVYAMSNQGVTTVLASADSHTTLSINRLGERTDVATPAIAGGRLYVRGANGIVCIEKEAATSDG
jgi:outer membrane protein assembly factor BamB